MTDIRLRLPFDGPWKISQRFGARPEVYAAWNLKGHEGVDFNCPTGTPILAAADGIVAKVKLEEGEVKTNPYGIYLKIRHNGYETAYCHLSQILVTFGQQVKAGDVIGLSGNTGNVWPVPTSAADNTSGAHLHFGLRIDGYDRGDGFVGYTNAEPYFQATIAQRLAEWWSKATGDVA